VKIGFIAPKNSPQERAWLASFFPFPVEEYQRGRLYDAVIFWNLTPEAARIKAVANTLVCAVGVEPDWLWPANYDPELLRHCDYYSAYRNFADARFKGVFRRFVYFADSEERIRSIFRQAIQTERLHDFVLFARHDPNIRRRIGEALRGQKAVLAGPLFNQPVADKAALQRTCRFEFITENAINDWYMSEKLPQSIVAGCVPVYHGCTRAGERVDPSLFIDLRAFGDPEAPSTLDAVVRHCLAGGTYERYFGRIQQVGERYLTESFSLEKNLVQPLADFIHHAVSMGFHPRRRWFAGRLRLHG
jgi:hypothetical protein